MKYADILYNDTVDTLSGIVVSFWTQGCPHKCLGCHNPQTWNFEDGKDFTEDTFNNLLNSISANGIKRNLSILGGEPLCKENLTLIKRICSEVRKKYPFIIIYIWTGYKFKDLQNQSEYDSLFSLVDYIIDGEFILSQRDITLPLRGSKNQKIWYRQDNSWIDFTEQIDILYHK